ncbi:MAG: peptidyl-prolyl cis-trans isomerase, partial [bacterium]
QEEELLRSYEEYYPPRERFTLRHILLRTEAGSDAEQMAAVKERAEEILSRARAGASFGDLARRHSEDDSSAAAGGYLGTFQRGEMIPELEKAALGLEVGQPGGPVRTSMGYHVLMLESRDTAPPPPLSTVRDELERALSAEKRQKAQEEWLKELRRQAYIETFPEAR